MTAPGTPSGEPIRSTLVDSRGRRCPLPVIDLARAAKGLRPGVELVLLADDPAAATDVSAWCRVRGHLLVGQDGDRFVVRLGVG